MTVEPPEEVDLDATVVPTTPRPGFASIDDAPLPDAAPTDAGRVETTATTLADRVRGESTAGGTGRGVARSSTTGTAAGSSSALRTEADAAIASALAEEEAVRARGFSLSIAVACALVAISLPVLGGDALARAAAYAALAVIFAASAYVRYRARDPHGYTIRLHRAYGLVIGTFVGFIEFHLGLFSPMPVVLTLGVLFVGQSADLVGGLIVPAYVIVRWVVLAALVAFGVLPDLGLITAAGTDLMTRVFIILAVAMVLVFTLRMARLSRASLNDAMHKAQEAILVAHARSAQLEEAKQNLDRALRAVVGKRGRYSGAAAAGYVLDEIIGVGAMGEVYAARRPDGVGEVAVKLMQAESAERDDLVERFLREGELCRRLRSHHVVSVLDVGRMDDGSPFMVMERLRGEDLASRLRRDGRLELDETIALAREMAAGLDEAHAAGIVHRDLKPQNLFHADSGEGRAAWKILDFGVSKLAGSTGTLTRAEVVGTPGYMSPEQARGRPVDARSDLFSMAVVLYRAITGQPAFNGANVPEKLFEIVYRMPDAPSKVRPELPSDLDLVFAIALAKNPAHRFDSASALAKAFSNAAAKRLSKGMRERGLACVRRTPWGETATVDVGALG